MTDIVTVEPILPLPDDRMSTGAVTTSNVVFALSAPFVTTIEFVGPAVTGIVNDFVNPPVELIRTETAVPPLNLNDAGVLGIKLNPVIATDCPATPMSGVTVTTGVVTVNGAVANVVPDVALTVAIPLGDDGMVNLVRVNVPVADVVLTPGTVIVVPLKNILIGLVALNADPDTTSDVPLGPFVGLSVMDGVIVNVAFALLNPSFANMM